VNIQIKIKTIVIHPNIYDIFNRIFTLFITINITRINSKLI